MTFYPPRYSCVPWLRNDLDLEEGRKFLWEIDYLRDEDKALCMAVADPFQNMPSAYLVVHATRGNGNDGGQIKVALSDSPRYDVYAKDVFVLNRRAQGDGDDGA